MKVLFVYPNIVDSSRPRGLYHMGIGYLSSVLKKEGHAVSLLNIYKKMEKEIFLEKVAAERADLLAFSATSHMFPFVKDFCGWLQQENLRIKTICGGVHATLAPQEVIEVDGLDMVCVGEGEAALAELCRRLQEGGDISGIKNIWIKTREGVRRNPVGPLLENLDELPFPDRDIFDYRELSHESAGRLPISASRGCPYGCAYCCNHALRDIYPNKGGYVRFRSPANVTSEIREVLGRYAYVQSILFHDDILFLKKEWYENFIVLYKKEVGIPFSCNMRPDLVNEEIAALLKEGGCSKICIGIESGNERVRNDVLKRRIRDEQIRQAFRLCRSKGIEVYAFNMIGMPYENPSDVLDTIKLNSEVSAQSFQVSIFYPYVGTELYDLSREKGFLTTNRVDDYFEDSKLRIPTMSRTQILVFRRYFVFLVRLYSALRRLGPLLSKRSTRILDHLLTKKIVAHGLNAFFVFARGMWRMYWK